MIYTQIFLIFDTLKYLYFDPNFTKVGFKAEIQVWVVEILACPLRPLNAWNIREMMYYPRATFLSIFSPQELIGGNIWLLQKYIFCNRRRLGLKFKLRYILKLIGVSIWIKYLSERLRILYNLGADCLYDLKTWRLSLNQFHMCQKSIL